MIFKRFFKNECQWCYSEAHHHDYQGDLFCYKCKRIFQEANGDRTMCSSEERDTIELARFFREIYWSARENKRKACNLMPKAIKRRDKLYSILEKRDKVDDKAIAKGNKEHKKYVYKILEKLD